MIEIKMLRTKDIKPYKNNPRSNNNAVEPVMNSIKEFGFKIPIVIDRNNIIVAGHTRLKAAEKLGLDEIPCIIADDLTEDQINAFRLADNKTGELATWDLDLLSIELESILDLDMSNFGFETDINLEMQPTETIIEDIPLEAPEKPKAKRGQIYQLGNHRLMCGDSTSIEDVEKLVGGVEIDMVFTDPPYNANYVSRVDKTRRKDWGGILNDNMSKESFDNFLNDFNNIMNTVLKKGASIYECIDWKHYSQLENVFKRVFNHKSTIVWNKNYFGLGTYYRTKYELILFGCKDKKIETWNARHNEEDVWSEDRETLSNYVHPTQKPISIPARAIKNSSKKSDKVLDLFGGSGTTLIACQQLDRICYMMEYDPKYIDCIISRWEKFTNKKAILLSN